MTSFLISWLGVINFEAGKWAEKRKKIMKMCPKINSLSCFVEILVVIGSTRRDKEHETGYHLEGERLFLIIKGLDPATQN